MEIVNKGDKMNVKNIIIYGVFGLLTIHPLGAQNEPGNITDPKSIFEKGYIQVTGSSEQGQTQAKALRVAQLVAQRALLETLQGLQLQGKTTIKKGMLESDEIRTSVEGYLQGAVQCGEVFHADKGYAEVCMRVPLRGQGGIYKMFMPLIQNKTLWAEQPAQARFMTKAMTEVQPQVSFAPASCPGASSVYDGLIIDVRKFGFKPALANRVLNAKNELVFGPARIAGTVLIERGCGAFTTDLNKAKAMLAQWGSACPLVLTPTDIDQETDVRLSEEDAAALLAHDEQSAMLAQAKVVYVLK